ncbi:MAG: hypothetical protein F6J92_18910 [Symploca sp. SIO1A3]|nr:hypothetical protein [Symploca sp. SIO1A3]
MFIDPQSVEKKIDLCYGREDPSDLKETRGRGDTETRREGFSCIGGEKTFSSENWV